MKLIFDLDGTLTNFNNFIEKYAIPYFWKKYNMDVIDETALEIEDIFAIKEYYLQMGYSQEVAEAYERKIVKVFWYMHFLQFILGHRVRTGVALFIRKQRKEGIEVEIHTSRAYTCKKNILGFIARGGTILQLWLNGIFLRKRNIFFYADDINKLQGIKGKKPTIVFEDKAEIISAMQSEGYKVICVSGKHNQSVISSNNVEIITSFDCESVENKMMQIVGKSNITYLKKDAVSNAYFQKLCAFEPLLRQYFHPFILHSENIVPRSREGVIFAPNHRSTLDPLVIETVLKRNIHWAALKRFFEGKDSIFNNSKNPVLCKITSWIFNKLDYFPIERKWDNEQANNFDSVRKMHKYLAAGCEIGIFGEGTTRRDSDKQFGNFDTSFLLLAKKNNAWIQPITIYWYENNKKKNVILNFGKAFQIGEKSMEESERYFLDIQTNGMRECIMASENY